MQEPAPGDDEDFPAGQFVHVALLVVLYWPAGHDVQLVACVPLYVPAGHAGHEPAAITFDANVPLGQDVHDAEPAVE